jgi:cell division protein FtsB
LVAEEVNQAAPGLVGRTADGKLHTVYYQFLAPMLLNEVQKQQRTIASQAARIADLERQMARLAKQVARLERPDAVAAAGR